MLLLGRVRKGKGWQGGGKRTRKRTTRRGKEGGTEGKKKGRWGRGRRLDTEGKNAAAEVFRARKGLEIFTVVNSGCFAMA